MKMKKSSIIFSLLFLTASVVHASVADRAIVAQRDYEGDTDGVLLLSTPCPADRGFSTAFKRERGRVLQGCYLLNTRGNPVVKWNNDSIEEIDRSSFNVKNSLPKVSVASEQKRNDQAQCRQVYQAWVFNKTLEDTCGFTRGVAPKVLLAAKDICLSDDRERNREAWAVPVYQDVTADIKKMGKVKFCESNRKGYEELADAQAD